MTVIVRGYIVPKYRQKEFKWSEKITEDKLDDIFSIFNDKVINAVKKDFKDNAGNINSIKELNDFLNLLAIRLKRIQYIDLLHGTFYSPLYEYYMHYLENHMGNGRCDTSYALYREAGIKNHVERLVKKNDVAKDDMISTGEMELLMAMPADTRIGLNTSSLVTHLISTSSIAYSIGVSEGLNEEELVIIRLISLFHDVGKIKDWVKHEMWSAEYIEHIFNDLCDHHIYESIIKKASNILREADETNRIYNIFKEADKIASEIDRVSMILNEALSDNMKKMLHEKINSFLAELGEPIVDSFDEALNKMLKYKKYWRFWNEWLSPYERIKLTEDFCKNVANICRYGEKIYHSFVSPNKVKLVRDDVYIVRVDIAGIQKYIWSNDLRSLAGGSRIVDIVVYESIPDLLINIGLPYESILSYGGGNLTFIIPKKYLNKVLSKLKGGDDGLDIKGINVRVGYVEIYNSYPYINKRLEEVLAKQKIFSDIDSLSENGLIDVSPLFRKCKLCGRNPAIHKKDSGDTMCESCTTKWYVGDLNHFRYRYNAIRDLPETKDIRMGLSKMITDGDILMFIAGHSLDESIKKRANEYRSISVVRFDANLFGMFMSTSISITDALERSIRADRATKMAINEFFEMLRKDGSLDWIRFLFGLLYVGGDDGVLILPARLAVPFSIHMIDKFYKFMGGRSTLSIGIVSAKPKHPIIPLYDSAGHILDEYAKLGGGRALTFRDCMCRTMDDLSMDYRGAVSFINMDTGRLSPHYIDLIQEYLYMDGLTLQYEESGCIYEDNIKVYTYLVSGLDSKYSDNSIFNLLNISLYPIKDKLSLQQRIDMGSLDSERNSFIGLLIDRYLLDVVFDKLSESEKDKIKNVKRFINDVISISVGGESDIRMRITYISRKDTKEEESLPSISEIIKYLVPLNGRSLIITLGDLDYIYKIIGGGIL